MDTKTIFGPQEPWTELSHNQPSVWDGPSSLAQTGSVVDPLILAALAIAVIIVGIATLTHNRIQVK